MQNSHKTLRFCAGIALAIGMAGATAPAVASDSTATETQADEPTSNELGLQKIQVDDSTVKFASTEAEFFVEGDAMKVKDTSTGEVGDLPSKTIGSDGETLTLGYQLAESGELLVTGYNEGSGVTASNEITPSAGMARSASVGDDAKCWGGVFGGAGTTAVAGGGLGALGGPGGAMAGAIGGSIVGGINGAVNHCFE